MGLSKKQYDILVELAACGGTMPAADADPKVRKELLKLGWIIMYHLDPNTPVMAGWVIELKPLTKSHLEELEIFIRKIEYDLGNDRRGAIRSQRARSK